MMPPPMGDDGLAADLLYLARRGAAGMLICTGGAEPVLRGQFRGRRASPPQPRGSNRIAGTAGNARSLTWAAPLQLLLPQDDFEDDGPSPPKGANKSDIIWMYMRHAARPLSA